MHHHTLSCLVRKFYKEPVILLLTVAFLLYGSLAFAIEITGVSFNDDNEMILHGTFDTDISPPSVWVEQLPLPVLQYDNYTIVTDATLLFTLGFLNQFDTVEYLATVSMNVQTTIEDANGNDTIAFEVQSAEYCFVWNPILGQAPYECTELLSLVPEDRKIEWVLPNDPAGTTYVDFNYKFGPTEINSKKNKRGDPVYYQLLHDYSISIKEYLDNYDQNNFGDTLLDRCDWALSNLKSQLETLAGKQWPDINPFGDAGYIAIDEDGILSIKKGYRWDGPTLDAGKTRILPKPSSLMRSSCVHDAIYDLLRLGVIEREFYNRKLADCQFYMLSRQDHNIRTKAKSDFTTIRNFGWTKTDEDLPHWKFHATADAGEDAVVDCAPNTGYSFELNGENSNDAETYEWSITDHNGALVTTATGAKPQVLLQPGDFIATLTVDDGNDGDVSELYKDTDKTEITIVADTQAPVFLLAEDIAVANDPGLCAAMIDFKIIATDECRTPTVTCTKQPGNEPVPVSAPTEFPVGTTQVVCSATDDNNSTDKQVQVTVSDTEGPVMKSVSSPLSLWPPNHRYATFTIADFVQSVSDNCDELALDDLTIVNVTSNESDEEKGVGDGATSDDIIIAADGKSVQLRQERQGTGDGRIYTVYIEASDNSDNTSSLISHVYVADTRKAAPLTHQK